MKIKFFLLLFILGNTIAFSNCKNESVISKQMHSSSYQVNSIVELQKLLDQEPLSDTIILKDGSFDECILTIRKSGLPSKPFVIKAQTPGKVKITGNTAIEIDADYVVLAGFYFHVGMSSSKEFKSRALIDIKGNHNRITDCAFFQCHNRSAVSSMYQAEKDYMPQFNRIDHCYFADNYGNRLYLDLGNRVPSDDLKYAMYYRVDHNYFSNPYKMGENTGSSMRIGLGQLGYGRCVVDHNLFERQDGEVELIENKSHENIYLNNTFRNCRSNMSFRQGHRTLFIHNILEATDSLYHYGGLGMWMDGHIVMNNYFSFPYGSFVSLDKKMKEQTSKMPASVVSFNPGQRDFVQPDKSFASHFSANNSLIANNVFYNCRDYIFKFDTNDSLYWHRFGSSILSLPYKNEVCNNWIINNEGHKNDVFYRSEKQAANLNKIHDNLILSKQDFTKSTDYLMENLGSYESWMNQIPNFQEEHINLSLLANTRIVDVIKLSKEQVKVKLNEPALSFENVGPSWLLNNPSDFATSGIYSQEMIQEIKNLIKN